MAFLDTIRIPGVQKYSFETKTDEIEKLLELTERWIRFITHPQSNICVVGGSNFDFRISGCPYRIISNIDDDKEYVCLQALKRQLSIYHNEHKCGSKIFMSTIAILCRCCLDCLQKGLSKDELSQALQRLTEFVQTAVRGMAIPCPRPQVQKSRSRSLYSRHGISLTSSGDDVASAISDLSKKLCHRPWHRKCIAETVSNLFNQNLNINDWKFHLHTAVLQSSKVHLEVYTRDGFLIRVNYETAEVIRKMESMQMKVLLLHGNLRQSHRHLGHEKKTPTVKVINNAEKLRDKSMKEVWRESVIRTLTTIGANTVLVSGSCCDVLRTELSATGIVVLVNVPDSLLETLSEQHDVDLFDYVDDATADDLIEDAALSVVEDSIFNVENMYCSLTIMGKSYQTICFNHSTMSQAKIGEEEFWHEFSRIHSALKTCRVLPGGGKVEEILADKIELESNRILNGLDTCDDDWASHVVLTSFGEILKRFAVEISSADRATDCDEDCGTILDALEPRVSAFQMSVNLIVTLLNVGTCLVLT